MPALIDYPLPPSSSSSSASSATSCSHLSASSAMSSLPPFSSFSCTPPPPSTACTSPLCTHTSAHDYNSPAAHPPIALFVAQNTASMICYLWFSTTLPQPRASKLRPRPNTPPHVSPEAARLQFVPSQHFVAFLGSLLSTTQVSQSVIVLALHYIYRLKLGNPIICGMEGSEFRLAVIALMLANKFVDDNTYTNKTWADVSGISLSEINTMEREFLLGVDNRLYVNVPTYDNWLNLLNGLLLAKEREVSWWKHTANSPLHSLGVSPVTSRRSMDRRQYSPSNATRRNTPRGANLAPRSPLAHKESTQRARSTSPAPSRLAPPSYNALPPFAFTFAPPPIEHANPFVAPTPPSTTPHQPSKRSAQDAFSPTSATPPPHLHAKKRPLTLAVDSTSFPLPPAPRQHGSMEMELETTPIEGSSTGSSIRNSPFEDVTMNGEASAGGMPHALSAMSRMSLEPSEIVSVAHPRANGRTLSAAYTHDQARFHVPQYLTFHTLASSPMPQVPANERERAQDYERDYTMNGVDSSYALPPPAQSQAYADQPQPQSSTYPDIGLGYPPPHLGGGARKSVLRVHRVPASSGSYYAQNLGVAAASHYYPYQQPQQQHYTVAPPPPQPLNSHHSYAGTTTTVAQPQGQGPMRGAPYLREHSLRSHVKGLQVANGEAYGMVRMEANGMNGTPMVVHSANTSPTMIRLRPIQHHHQSQHSYQQYPRHPQQQLPPPLHLRGLNASLFNLDTSSPNVSTSTQAHDAYAHPVSSHHQQQYPASSSLSHADISPTAYARPPPSSTASYSSHTLYPAATGNGNDNTRSQQQQDHHHQAQLAPFANAGPPGLQWRQQTTGFYYSNANANPNASSPANANHSPDPDHPNSNSTYPQQQQQHQSQGHYTHVQSSYGSTAAPFMSGAGSVSAWSSPVSRGGRM